ncbi:magnesium transporter CorA family protein [Planomicrobium sp. YIM 101495]|uniref:magnesium transporter CorA family protein n=1 Tax=Planomicrobium sp. YIM 101495 TaxID=2665160 RepID=UPI0012B94043|nr:magnesium transporter CorA family protein [Planomicrobium sp. YIM 101495]MTD31141.1 hypothetical protein [Planomicrobium sp. YIM 101495]
MLKKSFYGENWRWLILDPDSQQDTNLLPDITEVCTSWIDSVRDNKTSNLEMETTIRGEEAVWGGLVYHQNIEDQDDRADFHYYLSRDLLITTHLDASLLHNLSKKELVNKMQHAENAIEGFLIIMGEVIASFLQDIDAFEQRMHQLLWKMKENNDEKVFNQMMHNRHEILVWKNLIIPVAEIQEAIEEAFGSESTENIHYFRTKKRVRRCQNIIREYNEEIGEMIDIETVTSSQRGNEIVKTLTVITLLFTPASALGAIWGMNFANMPELDWRYGYLLSLILIALITGAFYYYLKKKNWMGSLLRSIKD